MAFITDFPLLPQAILRRRRFGMVIRTMDTDTVPIKVTPIMRPTEKSAQQALNYSPVQSPDLPYAEVGTKTYYADPVVRDMRNEKISRVEVNQQKLSVSYVDNEGHTISKKGGTKAWRTNNPGNLSFSSLERAREAGAIGVWEDSAGHKFGIFATPEAGEKALSNLWEQRRFSYNKDGSKRSIESAISNIYAPGSDNNDTRAYVNFLRKRGVDTNKSYEDLSKREKTILLQAIMAREGNIAGKITTR